MKDLGPYIELFTDLSPYCHTCEAVVLVAGTRVDPVAAAAIDRPGTEVFLQPDRQKILHMSGAEAELLISGRHEHCGIERHLWKPVTLARCDETITRVTGFLWDRGRDRLWRQGIDLIGDDRGGQVGKGIEDGAMFGQSEGGEFLAMTDDGFDDVAPVEQSLVEERHR